MVSDHFSIMQSNMLFSPMHVYSELCLTESSNVCCINSLKVVTFLCWKSSILLFHIFVINYFWIWRCTLTDAYILGLIQILRWVISYRNCIVYQLMAASKLSRILKWILEILQLLRFGPLHYSHQCRSQGNLLNFISSPVIPFELAVSLCFSSKLSLIKSLFSCCP